MELEDLSKSSDQESGKTPLHYICLHNSDDIIKHFINQGVSMKTKAKNGMTAIDVLLDEKKYVLISELISRLPKDAFPERINISFDNIHSFLDKK